MSNSYDNHGTFNYKNIMTLVALCIILLVSFSPSFLVDKNFGHAIGNNDVNRTTTNEINGISSKCNCVVFRMDDIQDYWLDSVQSAVMDLFMSKGQNLSLGLIMHLVGNDSKIVDNIKTGLDKGLFELDVHGWNHINYTKLSQNEQRQSLYNASMKMEKMFGIKPIVFIPPFDTFNSNTISAMKKIGMRIISSGLAEENRIDQNRSIFNANHISINNSKTPSQKVLDGNKKNVINNNNNNSNSNNNNMTTSVVYHLPGTIFFKDFQNGKWVKTPLVDILGNASRNIAKEGYAIIVLHPQDFANTSNGTTTPTNSVNKTEVSDLSRLIKNFVSRNVKTMPFDKVIHFSS